MEEAQLEEGDDAKKVEGKEDADASDEDAS